MSVSMYDLERQRKLNALKQARENSLAEYTTGLTNTNQERERVMPTFQVQRNQADARAAGKINSLRNRLAGIGQYRSGTMVSEEAGAMNQADAEIHDTDTQQNQFNTGMAQKIGELERVKAQKMASYADEERLANDEYAANVAQARASAARVSQPSGDSTLSAINQLQQFYNDGGSYASLLDQFNNPAVQAQMKRDGVNLKAVQDAMEKMYLGQTSSERTAWENSLNTEANQAGLGYMDKYDRAARLARGAYDKGVSTEEALRRYEKMMGY